MTLERVDADEIELGDIVVARVGDATMLHLVKALDHWNRQVEISGTSGSANGWTSLDRVVAICTQIDGKPVPGASAKAKSARGSRLLGIARRRY